MARNKCIKPRCSWSDLCIEILALVAQRLSYRDLVRFSFACKSWRQAALERIQGRTSNNYMPMCMTYAWFKHKEKIISIMELSDLSAKQTYSIGQIVREDVRELLVGAKAWCSRNGWLLFSKKVGRTKGPIYLFFYNLFCNNFIKLPPLVFDKLSRISEHVVTFTNDPTSLDGCVVYVLEKKSKEISHILRKYDLKNKTWSFVCITPFHERAHELAYIDGILFCGFERCSYLGAFDVQLGVWEMIDLFPLLKPIPVYHEPVQLFFVEEDGDGDGKNLYLVRFESGIGWQGIQFDRPNRKWVQVEGFEKVFGNRLVFFKCPSSMAIVPPAGEARDEFANKILDRDNVYKRCQKFENDCEVEWDIVCEWAAKKRLLHSTFIQVPKFGYSLDSCGCDKISLLDAKEVNKRKCSSLDTQKNKRRCLQ